MTLSAITLGRNERCHCGSGKKYKQCCLDKDEQQLRAQRAEAAATQPDETPAEAREGTPVDSHAKNAQPRQKLQQPWNRSARGAQGFARVNAPRKVGGGG